jgi:peptidoglycan hydrolase-like protein with peptidoglycan-binding domain
MENDDKPFANFRYELKVDRQTFEGHTDQDGKLEQEIPAEAKDGAVILYKSGGDNDIAAIIPLNFGHLNPVEDITGLQSRLNNLGFECGKADGILGPKTKAALSEFQRKHELPETGEPDPSTREKLRRIHDW